jgi:hypothetical protein
MSLCQDQRQLLQGVEGILARKSAMALAGERTAGSEDQQSFRDFDQQ